jgi:hypothetical protein
MIENWPPLEIGTAVRTVALTKPASDWTEEAIASRKFGVLGTIVHHHDSHGLCYDVRHEDGTEGCYDSRELVVLAEGREIQVGEILEVLHEWGYEDHDKGCPKDGSPCRHSRANIAVTEVRNVIREIRKRRAKGGWRA